MTKAAIYAGSFDPITVSHLGIIRKAARLVDKVVVAVAVNDAKKPMFTLEERVGLIEAACGEMAIENVDVVFLDNILVVDYAFRNGIDYMVRGFGSFSDFEFENTLYLNNRRSTREVETIFLMSDKEHREVRSSTAKSYFSVYFGYRFVRDMVAQPVYQAMHMKYILNFYDGEPLMRSRELMMEVLEKYRPRPYHNLEHLRFMLDLLRSEFSRIKKEKPERWSQLTAAILLHDYFEAFDGDNRLHIDIEKEFGVAVADLVQATYYDEKPRDISPEADVIRCLDLAVLGVEPRHYEIYAESVRREFAVVYGEDKYRDGRIAFIEDFLKRDRLVPLLDQYDRQARINLNAELAALKHGSLK